MEEIAEYQMCNKATRISFISQKKVIFSSLKNYLNEVSLASVVGAQGVLTLLTFWLSPKSSVT